MNAVDMHINPGLGKTLWCWEENIHHKGTRQIKTVIVCVYFSTQ